MRFGLRLWIVISFVCDIAHNVMNVHLHLEDALDAALTSCCSNLEKLLILC